MAFTGFYDVGTVTVTADSATVTGSGTLWTGLVVPGDVLEVAGLMARVLDVPSDTEITLVKPWAGATEAGADYSVTYASPSRAEGTYVAERVRELITRQRILDKGTAIFAVAGVGTNAPPGAPVEGDTYVIGAAPTGAWVGYVGHLATWSGTAWVFTAPETGMQVQDISADPPVAYVRGASAWLLKSEAATLGDLQDVDVAGKADKQALGWTESASKWEPMDVVAVVRAAHGDSAWSIPAGTTVAATSAALTAPRTWTLPAANAVPAGHRLDVQDAAGGITSANTLTIARAGADTIDGAATLVLDRAYEGATLISDGVSAWTVSVVSVAAGGTGARDLAGIRSNIGLRERLTANRTYYVRTDGSDSNTGLANTAGGAFLTIQKAIAVCAALDLATYSVTIQVGAGTYAGPVTVTGPWLGSGAVTVLGDVATPANVVIASTGNQAVQVFDGGRLNLSGVKVQTTTSGYGILARRSSTIGISGNVEFGACAAPHVVAEYQSTISFNSAYRISGAASIHWQSVSSSIACIGQTITIVGTPAFSSSTVEASRGGVIEAHFSTFSGGATGVRYNANTNGVIFTIGAGATFFPGDAAGSTATGGQYT